MKTFVAMLLVSSLAFADPPTESLTIERDTDSPVLAPDVPGVSVRLRPGEQAPFDGRLLGLDENLRRGREAVDCKAELASAKENVWTSKATLVVVIVGAVALGAAAGAGVTAWAMRR
jgi:hypothetical protein